MSFLIVVLDESARKIHVANAGHNWPYVISPEEDGTFSIRAVGAASPVLGADPDQVFDQLQSYDWHKNSKLFLYTDGLIDCYEGEQNLFDKRALLRALKANAFRDSAPMLAEVMKERELKTKGMQSADDVTVVICDSKGRSS